MENINFAVGSEKRFFEFISGVNDKDKIAVISHTDPDGIVSAKIVNTVLNADLTKLIDYPDINLALVEELKKQKIKKVIFTDLLINDPTIVAEIEKFSEVLIIDHHRFSQDYNSEKTVFLNPGGDNRFCAAFLCYYFFSKVQNLEKFDWLVAIAAVSDFATKESFDWLKNVYKKYGDYSEPDPTKMRGGKFNELRWTISLGIIYWKKQKNLLHVHDSLGESFGEIGDIALHAAKVQEEIDSLLRRFKTEPEELNGRIYWKIDTEFRTGSFLINMISTDLPDKTIIIARPEEKYLALSARRQDRGEDMNLLLRKLTAGLQDAEGGGHIPAGGGRCLLKDELVLKERLKKI